MRKKIQKNPQKKGKKSTKIDFKKWHKPGRKIVEKPIRTEREQRKIEEEKFMTSIKTGNKMEKNGRQKNYSHIVKSQI